MTRSTSRTMTSRGTPTRTFLSEARRWLDDLTDEDWFTVVEALPRLHKVAEWHGGSVPSRAQRRRAVPRLRKHVKQLADAELTDLLVTSFGYARELLLGRGYTEDQVSHPDLPLLRRMVADLPDPLARLVLHALLCGDAFASPVARAHRDELFAVIEGSTMSSGPADAGPATADGERSGDEPGSWSELRASVARLQADAVTLATRLRHDAETVESGRAPDDPGQTASLLTTFAATLVRLLSRGAEIGMGADADHQVTSLDDVLAAVDAAQRRARQEQEIEQERADLLAEHARLTGLIATATPRLRAAYEAALLEVERGLAELGPAVAEPAPAGEDESTEPGGPDGASAAASVEAHGPVEEVPDSAEPVSPVEERGDATVVSSLTVPPAAAPGVGEPVRPPRTTDHPAVPDTGTAATLAAPAAQVAAGVDKPDDPARASADELRLAFPWDAGDPPAVSALVADGRLAEAYWVTRASDESPLRADVLRLAYAAFSTTNAEEAGAVLTGWNVAVADPDTDRDAFLVELAALLRLGLAAGWTPRPAAVEALTGTLDEPWLTLLEAAADTVRRKGRLDLRTAGKVDDPQSELAELNAEARRLLIDLPKRKTKFQRATLLLPVLLATEQPLGTILDGVIRWSGGAGSAAEQALDELRTQVVALSRPDAIVDLIRSTDLATRGPTARERIHSGALRQLERAARQVLNCGQQAITLAEDLSGPEDGAAQALAALARAATDAVAAAPVEGVGGAALTVLARWIREPASFTPEPRPLGDDQDTPADVPDDVLLELPDLPRDADRRPLPDDPAARAVLAGLQDPRDFDEAVGEYCRRGMLDLADRLCRATGADGPRREIEVAIGRWRADTARLRDEVQALFEKVWMQNLMTDEAAIARVRGRLAARSLDGAAAYDLRLVELRDLQTSLQNQLDEQIARLRDKARAEVHDEALRSRIEAVLDDQDVVTANEFLAAQAGDEPIDIGAADPVATLREFVEGVRTGVDDPADPAHWAELFRRDDTGPVSEAVELWFGNWARLREPAGARASLPHQAIQGVLRLLGLDPKPRGTVDLRLSKAFVVGWDVDAQPRDGSIIAELGSKAKGRYRVLVVRDERRGRSPLDDVEAGIDRPHIVLSMQPLTLEQRARAAQDARGRRLNAILVDAAVLGFLAARAPSSFRKTQQLTLPWTDYRPYRPFVAGLLPKELFVGREAERREIVAPDGAVFVYGGRQLGKSALLHQIRTDPGDDRVVAYLDVQALGRSDSPDRIWADLAEQLKGRGIVRASVSRPGPDVLRKEILGWLNEDDNRRILLLVDEADAFLTADSRELPSAGGAHNFPTVNRLKQLMEATDRRFKVVFTGLHQVQRFVRLSNVPTPHGGSVLIGPLGTADAYRLVVEPLAALGYAFERPELAWRLLAHTNFHPAPIQIICAELLSHLRRTRDAATPVPVMITAQDVDRTAGSQSVREPIAERTRITFNLEDRYRVLAMLLARKSLDDDFGSTYPAADLLEEAAAIWPDGFGDGFDENKLVVYLDEMVGLGLLVRSAPRTYAVRSPNVVSMLGNRQYFERELQAGDFETAYAYNPGSSRRLLGRSALGDVRSPFTDEELHQLVGQARAGVVPLVTGCTLSAVERLQDALGSYLDAEDGTVVGCGPEQLTTLMSAPARSAPSCLVVDLRGTPPTVRNDALDRSARGALPVVALVDPDDAVALLIADDTRVVLSPQRWTIDSVRAWPDCPYDTPDRRRRLIEVTAGWPRTVEAAVHGAGQARQTTATALAKLEEAIPADAQDAKRILLTDLGLDAELIRTLSFWAHATDPGEEISRIELPGVLSLDREDADRVELRLRLRGVLSGSPTGVRLDELTHRCLNRMAPAE